MTVYEAPAVGVVPVGELAASAASLASSGGGGETEVLPTLAETLYQNFAIGFESDNYRNRDVCLLIEAVWVALKNYYSNSSAEFQSWVFFRSLGGICYNDSSDLKNAAIGLAWDEIAGPNIDFDYLVTYTLNLGTSISGAISKAVSVSHAKSKGVDFSHFCITAATHLAVHLNYVNAASLIGAFGLEKYGLSENAAVCALAGWLGDASLIGKNGVSMGNSDTIADLDADFIAKEYLTKGYGASLAIREGYFNMPVNRFDRFKLRNGLTKDLVLRLIFKMLINQLRFPAEVLERSTDELESLYKSCFEEAYECFIAHL